MRILLVNKFHYLKGGSETYYFSLKELLEEHGHEVIEFSMNDLKNLPSKYSDYFIDNIDYNKKQSLITKASLAIKLVYSFEAKNKIEKLIKDYKPDIAHLHIFQHQMTPSILGVLKKHKIPIVYTAHDFKMICPNYKMMLPSGEICEACIGEKYYNCLKNKCVKGSLSNSLVDMIEAYVHKFLKSYDMIDAVVTPSDFYRKKFVEFGVNKEKLFYIPNFLDISKFETQSSHEDYFVYFGRLSEEKGVQILIKAMENVEGKLKIIGTGPLENQLREYTKLNNLNNKVEFMGYRTGVGLKDILKKAMFVVVPSTWYENAPYSILEAMAAGKPVIGSDIGGIPELVKNNKTGLIFESGNYKELNEKISFLIQKPELLNLYGKNARNSIESDYNKESHYFTLINIYNKLIGGR